MRHGKLAKCISAWPYRGVLQTVCSLLQVGGHVNLYLFGILCMLCFREFIDFPLEVEIFFVNMFVCVCVSFI